MRTPSKLLEVDWLLAPRKNVPIDDPYKRLAYKVLEDAIKKSVPMCKRLTRNHEAEYTNKCAAMIESRIWLMDDEHPLNTDRGINRNMCMEALSLRKVVLFSLLRGLWLREDERLRRAMGQELSELKAAILCERRANNRNRGGDKRRIKHVAARRNKMLRRGIEVYNESMEWVRGL